MALVLQMRSKGEENEKLQKVIADKDKQLKKQETKMLQMAGLESEIQSLRAESKLSFQKMQSQHNATGTRLAPRTPLQLTTHGRCVAPRALNPSRFLVVV